MPPFNLETKLPSEGLNNRKGMSIEEDRNHVVFKLVLTGGPCSGKTTGQARLSTFLENYGWKVYRVPEAATVLLGGGVRFPDLNDAQVENFQENLLLTMMAMEKTFFDLAHSSNHNCVVICDRGTMDPSAFVKRSVWNRILSRNCFNEIDLRDNRYNQIVHLVSAARGAERFYSTDDHATRSEDLELARERDELASKAWVGHPYIEVIDNSTDFDTKMRRLIDCVCRKIGVPLGDRFAPNSRKIKFLVKRLPADDSVFPTFQDFEVVHDYLISPDPHHVQGRLRKRGQNGIWSYTHTQRKRENPDSQVIELKRTIAHRDYINMLAQRDPNHLTVFKRRRCFIWNNYSFQLDIYKEPCNPKCKGLIILEVYTSCEDTSTIPPEWLDISHEVTHDPQYSMFILSRTETSTTQQEAIIMVNGTPKRNSKA